MGQTQTTLQGLVVKQHFVKDEYAHVLYVLSFVEEELKVVPFGAFFQTKISCK